MCKKVTAFFVAFVMVLTLVLSAVPFSSISVQAVSTEAALKSALSNGDSITLTANITMTSSFTVIGEYKGTFDGNGYVISGLINPLFNKVSGTIKNLGVVAGNNFTADAILARELLSKGSIMACFAYGDITYSDGGTVGGLVATLNGGSVTESFSCVNITSTSSTNCAGLIGEVKSGSVSACYSAGTIDCTVGKVAGLANYQNTGSATDTYTTCQIVKPSLYAKASGTKGLYDNQLSIVRESVELSGQKTRELMETTKLSNKFAVTSTAYPSLTTFYDAKWCVKARSIARVSTAAASVSDVTKADRKEPSTAPFFARMDYLTHDIYIDKTNVMSLAWAIDSESCKIYDVVPDSEASSIQREFEDADKNTITVDVVETQSASTSADLLRSRFVFADNAEDAILTATSAGYSRKWYLSAYDANPYFAGGNGNALSTAFEITSKEQLDNVRYYSLLGFTNYKLTDNVDLENVEFDPIDNFIGAFNGNSKTVSNVILRDNGTHNVGLFANTRSGSSITDLELKNVQIGTAEEPITAMLGALIGSADDTEVRKVIVSGENTKIYSGGITGGLIGEAYDCVLDQIIVSASIEMSEGYSGSVGGIVGEMYGGTLTQAGSTGYIRGAEYLGGLVGMCNSAASVNNAYSSMALFSSSQGDVLVGGLIGDATSGMIDNAYYYGSISTVAGATAHGPIVGKGTAGTACYFDATMSSDYDTHNGAMTNVELTTMKPSSLTDDWTKQDGLYPQLACFDTDRHRALSQLSVMPFFFQNYWEDTASNTKQMTTGWIDSEIGEVSIDELATLDADDDSVVFYETEKTAGHGFEAKSGADDIAIKAIDEGVGIRVIAAPRNTLQKVTYSVDGISGIKTYLEIYYSTDGETWLGSQLKAVSGQTTDQPLMYDLPKDCQIKVKVTTVDDYSVKSVTVNATAISVDTASNAYITTNTYSDNIHIVVTLQNATPPWGLHEQIY